MGFIMNKKKRKKVLSARYPLREPFLGIAWGVAVQTIVKGQHGSFQKHSSRCQVWTWEQAKKQQALSN